MRAAPNQLDDRTCRRAIAALDGLPIRPSVARQAYVLLADDPEPGIVSATTVPACATDPGWMLAETRDFHPLGPADLLISQSWWSSVYPSPAAADALTRLWRHSVAVSFAARRIARAANAPDAERIARAGLLHLLGLWGLAAVDPERLAAWVAADRPGRLAMELRWFGGEVAAAGRRLAERWGCDPLVADAAWLCADRAGDLNASANEPYLLAMIQQAYQQAGRTAWSIDPDPTRDFGPTEPGIRVLTAEVQARTSSPFVAPDASPREEALTRENLRLRQRLGAAETAGASAARIVAALAEVRPTEVPQAWADRAALAWCQEPGVAAARVVWRDHPAEAADPSPAGGLDSAPGWVRPLGERDRPVADLAIWEEPGAGPFAPASALLAGWDGWARDVADRERITRALDRAVAGHRERVGRDEAANERGRLASLAEFAAGAGHELNNPLAVIMGRAQLVLARTADAEVARSLRAIIAQVQRAHRILRDLMFVARPGDPRPRACQPNEVVRASLRDLQGEAEAQGVRFVLDVKDSALNVWADPEPLRQVADILTRNALEASSSGATIRFVTGGDARKIRWTVHDSGRGITASEGVHLFDPFYCGRQAGRGLGLGLPRAARIIDQAGGQIRWHSTPGEGSSFQVTLPAREIPAPAAPDPATLGADDGKPPST